MKKIKPTTIEIAAHQRYFEALKAHHDLFLIPTRFKKITLESISEYLKAVSDAEATLWHEVFTIYPESRGYIVTVTPSYVSWEVTKKPKTK